MTDVDGGANVSALFYNRDLPSERYNMPDTLKAQYTAFLSKGRVLLSDRGRVLCSITDESSGWHDTLCGHVDSPLATRKYGVKRYQQHRNDYQKNARDGFLVELAKWGLDKRDLVATVNFFSKVTADEEGRLHFVSEHARPGGYVDLRAEMNVIVVLASAPHPLDPDPSYGPKRVKLTVYREDPPGALDPCRTSRPEAARAFENTERYWA